MNVINDYYFLKENGDKLKRLKECDFNLLQDQKFKNNGKNIPLSLRSIKTPLLVLFYYNRTDIDILNRWEEVGKEDIRKDTIDGLDYTINCGFVNLDYENNILSSFQNISLSNPFKWAKVSPKDRNYFVIFYYKRFPQYYYKGFVNKYIIEDDFKGWFNKLKIAEDEKGNKFKTIGSKFTGDDSLYRVKKARPLLTKKDEIFQLKEGDIYKVVTDNQDNYQLISKITEKEEGEIVFEGKIYQFESIFQELQIDTSNIKEKKQIYLEPDMFDENIGIDDDKEKALALKKLYQEASGTTDSFSYTS